MKRIEKIEKFEKVINENNNSMLRIMILYIISCYDNYKKMSDIQKEKLLGFLYNIYLKDETKTDLEVFVEIAMNNYRKVLNKEITRYNIYNFLEV